MSPRIAWLLALAFPFCVQAQAPAPPVVKPAGTGVIEGKVLKDATGEPLRGVRVELASNSQNAFLDEEGQEIVTDETGQFAFRNLPAGIYSLSVSRAGYVTQSYGEGRGGFRPFSRGGTPLNLAEGQQMRDLQFKLVAGAVITGRVLDRYGDPMEGAAVTAQKPGSFMASFFESAQEVATNDLGEYRVYGLAPGEYVVVASPGSEGTGFMRLARRMEGSGKKTQTGGDGQKEAAAQTYYPNVTEAARATRLQVQAGQETTGIDITILPVRVYAVRGRVTIPTDSKPEQVRLMMIRTDGAGDASEGTTAKPDGSFEIEGVPAGSYRIMAMGMDSSRGFGSQYMAQQEVTVSSADVEGLSLHLGGGAQVTGRLRFEQTQEIPKYTSVMLVEQGEAVFGGGGNAQVKNDGTFEMKSVAPGTYQVGVTIGLEKGYYLKEARLGGQDVRESLNVSTAGVVGLDLVMGNDGGTVSGRVLTDESLPAPGAQVLLLPADDKRMKFDTKYEQADQNGRYLIRGVRPGEYKVLALDELNPADFMGLRRDEDFSKKFQDQGVAVQVGASGQHVVDVTVTRPKKQP